MESIRNEKSGSVVSLSLLIAEFMFVALSLGGVGLMWALYKYGFIEASIAKSSGAICFALALFSSIFFILKGGLLQDEGDFFSEHEVEAETSLLLGMLFLGAFLWWGSFLVIGWVVGIVPNPLSLLGVILVFLLGIGCCILAKS